MELQTAFNDVYSTGDWIVKLREQATLIDITGILAKFVVGPYGIAMTVGASITSQWPNSFSDELQRKNRLGDCGTVEHIKSYTAIYTV